MKSNEERCKQATGDMNRAYLIIVVPAALVLMGYVAIFRAMRMVLPWMELIVPAVLLGAAMWWMARRARGKELVK